MQTPVSGSCICGAVAFRVKPPFLAFPYCHCSRCRKKTGSAHAANGFVPVAQLEWIRGEDHVRKWDLENTRWSSAFCTTCGCSMPWVNRTGAAMIVPVGSFDDDPGERPRAIIHFASRAPWYAHASELIAHDALPPEK